MAQATKRGDKSTRWIVIAMVLLVVLTGVVFSMMSQNTKENASLAALDSFKSTSAVASTIDDANGSAITFNAGATTAIDIWEDPQCPSCKAFENATGEYLNRLISEKKTTLRFHVLSFLGDESVRAANASFCAAAEGRYLDLHSALYLIQSGLENSGFWSNETLVSIGKKIGITSSEFATCVNKGQKIGLVQIHAGSMAQYGVQGTPTVFINGKLWERKSPGFDLGEFTSAVEAG